MEYTDSEVNFMNFTEQERAILAIVQDNLPENLTPYADIAKQVGVEENFVITFLQSLKDNTIIRRFGASIKHQRTGYSHNAMVAWIISDDLIDQAGEQAAKNPFISHCYHRPSDVADWPYTFYTMIHGKKVDDCQKIIEELRATTPLDVYVILESLKELKKSSMKYFVGGA